MTKAWLLFAVCLGWLALAQGSVTFSVDIGLNPNYPNPPAWGESYHINGVETPVLYLHRGTEYTFEIFNGVLHPFYITDSSTGGRQGTDPNENIYAGGANAHADMSGAPFSFSWTPDASVPDVVYYQCWTHNKIGWKIRVLDAGLPIPLQFSLGPNDNYPGPTSASESIYVNGVESPVLTLVRGQQYLLESIAGTANPIYITTDTAGGQSSAAAEIFAGAGGSLAGTAGSPATETWTPDGNTPDTVFYQSFTNPNLGWVLNITDAPAGTLLHPTVLQSQPPAAVPSLPILNDLENCLDLDSTARLYWTLEDSTTITYTLQVAIETGVVDWLGFGLSQEQTVGSMVGADVTIGYIANSEIWAVDYFLESRVQCNTAGIINNGDAPSGVCPDGGIRQNILTAGDFQDGILTVTYTRVTNNMTNPNAVNFDPTVDNFVVWGKGPICNLDDGTVCQHQGVNRGVFQLNFSERSSCLPRTAPCYPSASSAPFDNGSGATAHNVSGTFSLFSEDSIVVEGFSYDGLGPDTFFYLGTAGSFAGGVAVSPQLARAYVDETYIITLDDPALLDTYTHLSVWCDQASVDFGSAEIPLRPVCFPDPESDCYPGGLSESFALGPNPAAHEVTGAVAWYGNSTLVVSNFTYDGLGPDTFFYVGVPGDFGNGVAVSAQLDRRYDSEVFIIQIPSGVDLSVNTHLSVWCDQAGADFGNLEIPLLPICIPEPQNGCYPGELSDAFGPVTAHDVTGVAAWYGDNTLVITEFSYDGLGPDTFFFLGTPGDFDNGVAVSAQLDRRYNNEVFILNITTEQREAYTHLSVWCDQANADFGNLELPPLPDCLPQPEACYPSETSAQFESGTTPNPHNVAGQVTWYGPNTLVITDFNYDGTAPDTFIYLGAPGDFANGVEISEQLDREYVNDVLILTVTDEQRDAHTHVSVWCDQAGVDFGNTALPALPDCFPEPESACYPSDPSDRFGVPTAHDVDGYVAWYGRTSLVISEFSYDGLGPDTYIQIGNPGDFANGVRISEQLDRVYDNEVLVLSVSLEDQATYSHISVWCDQAAADFGNLALPAHPDPSACLPVAEPCFPSEASEVFAIDGNAAAHDVTGTVQFYGERTLVVTGFSYDGLGPDTYFYLGNEGDLAGEIISSQLDRAYDNEVVVLEIDPSVDLSAYTRLSVWCRQASANFGDTALPALPEVPCGCYPSPPASFSLAGGTAHDVEGTVTILSPVSIRIDNFTYDGTAPAVSLYLGVDRDFDNGKHIVGSELDRAYDNESFTLWIEAGDLDTYNTLSVWCEAFSANFGDLDLPELDDANCPSESSSGAQPSSSSSASTGSQSSDSLDSSSAAAAHNVAFAGLAFSLIFALL